MVLKKRISEGAAVVDNPSTRVSGCVPAGVGPGWGPQGPQGALTAELALSLARQQTSLSPAVLCQHWKDFMVWVTSRGTGPLGPTYYGVEVLSPPLVWLRVALSRHLGTSCLLALGAPSQAGPVSPEL